MLLYKITLHLKWKLKILLLKVLFGKHISVHWNDRIAFSVKVRINDDGKIIIGENVEIRENVILNVSCGGIIRIGDSVFISDGCCINSRELVQIDKETMLGQGVKIYDHDHDYHTVDMKEKFIHSAVMINERVWICSDVIVLKGATIGKRSVIAAGTVVRRDVSPNVLCYARREVNEKPIEIVQS
ncbi:MAG: acyltransferase [Oscillospiraceae bacterium]|nr:acyltransferase [Oscillospiraceae bacterium]